jgi:hypothetical protein
VAGQGNATLEVGGLHPDHLGGVGAGDPRGGDGPRSGALRRGVGLLLLLRKWLTPSRALPERAAPSTTCRRSSPGA